MGFRDDWFDTTVLTLVQLRGQYGSQSTGDPVPVLSALELLSVVGQLVTPLADAIRDHHRRSQFPGGGVDPDLVPDIRALEADGTVNVSGYALYSNWISVADYLGGVAPNKTKRYERYQTTSSGTPKSFVLYAPYTNDEVYALSFLRSAVGSYDKCLEAAANAIRNVALATDRALLSDANAFWNGIRELCSNLDVIIDDPIAYYGDRLKKGADAAKEATKDALEDVSEFAGKAAAEIAAEAGEIAGRTTSGFSEGFLKNAGILSFVVAGLVVYLYLT
jgi:hypothetical protein